MHVMTNGQNGTYIYQEILRSIALVYDWSDFKPRQEVYNQEIDNFYARIQTSHFESGIYMIKTRANGFVKKQKLIIQ